MSFSVCYVPSTPSGWRTLWFAQNIPCSSYMKVLWHPQLLTHQFGPTKCEWNSCTTLTSWHTVRHLISTIVFPLPLRTRPACPRWRSPPSKSWFWKEQDLESNQSSPNGHRGHKREKSLGCCCKTLLFSSTTEPKLTVTAICFCSMRYTFTYTTHSHTYIFKRGTQPPKHPNIHLDPTNHLRPQMSLAPQCTWNW